MPMKSAPQFGGDRCRHCPNGWVCSSAGEHRLHTAGVTGSIPVTPTIQLSPWRRSAAGGFRFPVFRKRNAPLGRKRNAPLGALLFQLSVAGGGLRVAASRIALVSVVLLLPQSHPPGCAAVLGGGGNRRRAKCLSENKRRHEEVHPARCATATVAGNSLYCDLGRARFSPYFM